MVLTTLIGGNRESRTLTDGTYARGRNLHDRAQSLVPRLL